MAWHNGPFGWPDCWYPEAGNIVRVIDGDNEGKSGTIMRTQDGEDGDYSWMNVIIKIDACGCVITVDQFDVEEFDGVVMLGEPE